MSKETFDFSEALRRMKEGKKVRRKIFADGTYAYIDKNNLGSEALMYNSVGRAAPVLWLLPETILATDWEEVVRMEKKVLTLTVSKQWFDMIVAGEKTEEYREIKAYWINRLIQAKYGESDEYRKVTMHPEFDMLISNSKLKELLEKKTARFIPYTYVRFFHGYAKNRPWIEKEIESITIGKPKKGLCPGKWLDHEFFIIKFK